MAKRITALQTFGRSLRDEPSWGIYKIRIYVTKDKVSPEAVKAWLSERYTRRMGLWQIVTYAHEDGNIYVNAIDLQKITENEQLEIKLRWGFSEKPVVRNGRLKPKKRLTKQQREVLDARLAQVREDFYKSLTA